MFRIRDRRILILASPPLLCAPLSVPAGGRGTAESASIDPARMAVRV